MDCNGQESKTKILSFIFKCSIHNLIFSQITWFFKSRTTREKIKSLNSSNPLLRSDYIRICMMVFSNSSENWSDWKQLFLLSILFIVLTFFFSLCGKHETKKKLLSREIRNLWYRKSAIAWLIWYKYRHASFIFEHKLCIFHYSLERHRKN